MKEEIWKPLVYNNVYMGEYYLISNYGNLKGVKTGKIRKLNINHEGYYFASISLGNRKIKPTIRLHKAVAENFITNINSYPITNHKDGNKLNNYYGNLEWCTYSYNTIHAYKNNLTKNNKKVKCINNGREFNSLKEAINWCGLKHHATLNRYLLNGTQEYCGKDPITKEKLQWCFI